MKAKCTLSVLLSLLLTFALPFYAAAAPAEVPTITVETKTEEVNAGDEVTLAVAMENNPGVNGFEFEIVYDSDKLELTDIATSFKHDVNGKEMNIPYWNGSYVPNTATGKILFAAADAVTDDGTMFTVTFAVKQDAAAGAAVVSIKCVMLGVKGTDNSNLYMNAKCVAGGVTIADNGTGGSTTGGSSTGGSTTGGSTTGGSTTGGSTTGGSTTGGSTTGGSTTGGSTTGGSTTGGSTTGGSTTGGSTTGGSTTGGSTTGGSTTGGSTTGGSTTGGSTTGGSTTGGSTTGGSTTGGSTTGGSTTGGSTTGGSTTGGSTTGGSTTGGSTTGGNTTGGNTTGAITVSDIGIGKDAYSVTGHTVTVNCEQPCRLGYLSNGQYIAVEAVANGDGTYSYEVPENVDGVLLVVKGDANGDGIVDVSDILRIKSYNLGTASLDAVQLFAADASGDDMADVADILRIKAHILGKTTLEW